MNTLFEQEKEWLLKEKFGGEKSSAFFSAVRELENGVPLAYLIGNIPFCGCTIDLEYRPLIPRVETEYWVNEFIKKELGERRGEATPQQTPTQILDIFSGSGCIGIAVLKNTENTMVNFAELNPKYIRQIEKNLRLNGITGNNTSNFGPLTSNSLPAQAGSPRGRGGPEVSIFQSDVFQKIPPKKYDFILANPPYISHDRMDTVEKSVLDHEDPAALFTDDDGLVFIKKLIAEAPQYLTPHHGKIYIEHGSDQKEVIEKMLKENNIANYEFLKDQYGKNRVVAVSFP